MILMAIKELYTNSFTNNLICVTDKHYMYNDNEKIQMKNYLYICTFLLCCEIKYLTRDPYT